MTDTETERAALYDAVENIANRVSEERSTLTELDSAIGDADHGANLDRGFKIVLEKLEDLEEPTPEEIAKTVGVAIISEVGGAAGPLYGGSCMHASQELADGITRETTVAFANAYLEKVKDSGGARVGDKTMVDALTPAVATYEKSIEMDDLPPLEALAKAVDAAERGVAFTVPIRASKGRASFLGQRSVGHQDPGATSTLFILEELLDTAEQYLEEGETDVDAFSPTIPDEEPEEAAE
ncbi:MAG: dihydroxyacetone kinase subunit DhaL [Halorhabdus sp.]